MNDKANILASIRGVIGGLTKSLTKRQISRLTPLLEDLLETYVLERQTTPGDPEVVIDFQGYVSINLLNLGMSDLFLVAADFDLNVVTNRLKVTGVWVWSPGKQQIVVDILFSDGRVP